MDGTLPMSSTSGRHRSCCTLSESKRRARERERERQRVSPRTSLK
jgi:hypothetical protein